MRKNGFTLVELLMTIAIIGILGAISIGVIINSIGGAKDDFNQYQEEMLISTAKLYFDDNVDTSTTINTSYNICIQNNLVSEDYLEKYEDSDGNDIEGIVVLTPKVDVTTGTITKVTASVSYETEDDYDCY